MLILREGGPLERDAEEQEIFQLWREKLRQRPPRLYLDGAPDPERYAAQALRVVFVFREPNMPMHEQEHDMCEELSKFEQTRRDLGAWWTSKVLLFAHAVASCLDGQGLTAGWAGYESLKRKDVPSILNVLRRFGYLQLKKTGGGGTSPASVLEWYVEQDHDLLKRQVQFYAPQLLIACGVGDHSPAKLLVKYVLENHFGSLTSVRGMAAWIRASHPPLALLETYHPSVRANTIRPDELYAKLWHAIHDVRGAIGGASE